MIDKHIITEAFQNLSNLQFKRQRKLKESFGWEHIDKKQVQDSDGFWTDYTLWYNSDEDRYMCIFGDDDLYNPMNTFPDFECETEEEAREWFDSYNGFADDEDEYYDDWMDESLKESTGKVFVVKSISHHPFNGWIELMDKIDKNGEGEKHRFTDQKQLNDFAKTLIKQGYKNYQGYPLKESTRKSSRRKSDKSKEIYDYLDELGGYVDYDGKIDCLVDDFGLSREDAENFVWDWASGLNELKEASSKDAIKAATLMQKVFREYPDISEEDEDYLTSLSYKGLVKEIRNRGWDEILKLDEDTVKQGKHWVNKGDSGKTHGKFATKKAADAQRKAMFANGYKAESLNEESSDSIGIFHNDNGIDYDIIERSESGKNLLLRHPRGSKWVVAWNCPRDNQGSWGQGHYFFDEMSARKLWNKEYANK